MNTAKGEPEIERKPFKKQEEAQEEPNPVKCDSDATENTMEGQTDENMERSRKAFYLDDEEADNTPGRKSSCGDEQEKAHGRKRGPYRVSESGQKASNKEEGPNHEDESREKIAQRILRRQKGQD